MKTIKILHLFPKLLSLYGEYGNIAHTELLLNKLGYGVEIVRYEDGEPETGGCSLIYMGAGTETGVLRAVKKLLPFRDVINSSVAKGDLWLCTGNSMAVFGKKIITDGVEADGLGIFDYITRTDTTKRYTGDVLTDGGNVFGSPLVGYVNTGNVYEGVENGALCRFVLGKELGNDKKTGADGFIFNNFYATQLTGPLLVKNPAAAEFFISGITGEKTVLPKDSHTALAYNSALDELKKRVQ